MHFRKSANLSSTSRFDKRWKFSHQRRFFSSRNSSANIHLHSIKNAAIFASLASIFEGFFKGNVVLCFKSLPNIISMNAILVAWKKWPMQVGGLNPFKMDNIGRSWCCNHEFDRAGQAFIRNKDKVSCIMKIWQLWYNPCTKLCRKLQGEIQIKKVSNYFVRTISMDSIHNQTYFRCFVHRIALVSRYGNANCTIVIFCTARLSCLHWWQPLCQFHSSSKVIGCIVLVSICSFCFAEAAWCTSRSWHGGSVIVFYLCECQVTSKSCLFVLDLLLWRR